MLAKQKNSFANCGNKVLAAVLLSTVAIWAKASLPDAALSLRSSWCQAPSDPAPPGNGTSPADQRTTNTPATKPPETTSKETAEDKDKVIVEHADKLRYDGDRKLYRLEGNVRFKHKDTVLTCDWAEYYEETDTAIARGHLQLQDPETTVTGDTVKIDFTDEVAEIEGNVVIVSEKKKEQRPTPGTEGETGTTGAEGMSAQKRPSNQGQQSQMAPHDSTAPAQKQPSDAKRPAEAQPAEEKKPTTIKEYRERKTTIYCTKVRYRYTEGQRYAWVYGPIRAEQKDRTAWADNAEYDVDDGILKLVGNVRVKTSDGDEFQCPAATVSLDEEWLRAEKVTGIAIRKKKGEGKQQTQPAGTEQSPPSPAPQEEPGPPQ